MTRARLPIWLCLPGILVGLAAGAKPPDDAQRLQGSALRYGSWALGCSNLRICTAIVPVVEIENGDAPAHVRLTFTANKAQPHAAAIVRDGKPADELSDEDAQRLVRDLLDPQTGQAMFASRRGGRLAVPRDGFAALTQALASWRAAPPQPSRLIDPVTPLAARPIGDGQVPPVVTRAAMLCPENHSGVGPQGWLGAGGTRLWQVSCANEGTNSVSFWFYSNAPGNAPRPIKFKDRDGHAEPFNSQFDAASGTLEMVHYFGGQQIYRHEDCGIYRSYGWTVKGLRLIEKRYMPFCGTRIGSDDWIVTFQAPVLIGSGGPR